MPVHVCVCVWVWLCVCVCVHACKYICIYISPMLANNASIFVYIYHHCWLMCVGVCLASQPLACSYVFMLQCVALCCSVLQRVAVCCSVLQYVSVLCCHLYVYVRVCTVMCVYTYKCYQPSLLNSTLQHTTTTHSNSLPHTPTPNRYPPFWRTNIS